MAATQRKIHATRTHIPQTIVYFFRAATETPAVARKGIAERYVKKSINLKMMQYIGCGLLFIFVGLTLPVLFQVELKENRKSLALGALIMVMLGMTTCTFGILSPVIDNCCDTTRHITPITSSIHVLMNPNDVKLADAETPEKQLEKLRLFMPASKA